MPKGHKGLKAWLCSVHVVKERLTTALQARHFCFQHRQRSALSLQRCTNNRGIVYSVATNSQLTGMPMTHRTQSISPAQNKNPAGQGLAQKGQPKTPKRAA